MKRFLSILMVIAMLLGSCVAFAEEETNPLIVDTTHGKVLGAEVAGIKMFKGIPYGSDPSGNNRFLPASPAGNWGGVLDCTTTAPIAYQNSQSISASWDFGVYFGGTRPEEFGFNGIEEQETEDCLVLSVVTPETDSEKRPVLVYLHGGGYSTGSGALVLGASEMVKDEDVVLVGVNHRLNVFGYLHLGAFDEKYAESGMAGMTDIVLALEWVRDNIATFGGDPNNVTIMGESGGGGKVSTLLAMPSAQGLFHKAVVESGASTAGRNSIESATEQAQKFLDNLGITSDELDKLADFTTEEIFEASQGCWFSPVADNINLMFNDGTAFEVSELSKDIPLMVGASEDENGSGASPESFAEYTDENLRDKLVERGRGITEENVDAIIEAYKAYHADEPVSAGHLWYNIVSTAGADGTSAHQMAMAKAEQGGANVYQYLVRYDSQLALYPGEEYRLAWHTSDLPLQLRIVYYPESEEVSKAMSSALAAFMRTGDPSTDTLEWPAFTTEDKMVMVWDDVSTAISDPMASLREAFK